MYLLLRKISLNKITNYLIGRLSYAWSLLNQKPLRWAFPYSVSIEPTNVCNLRCPQCPTGLNLLQRTKGKMDFELYKSIIDKTYKYLLNLFLYFQGEPLLSSDFFEMVKYADSKNIYVVTSTNAQLINDEVADKIVKSGLDKLIISVDGIDNETYTKYRIGGSLEKVLNGINSLKAAKSKYHSHLPSIELQFIVMKHNEKQINDFMQFARQMKMSYSLKSAQIVDFVTAEEFVPKIEKYSRYKKENDAYVLKKTIGNRCSRLWDSLVITWNGDVLPCCYDKDAEHSFGNVTDEEIMKIYNNEYFRKFAKQVLTDRKKIDICRNCDT